MPTCSSRVVLDTNVLIAAAYNPGSASARIVRLCADGLLAMVVSPELVREYELMLDRALHGPANRTAIDAAFELSEFVCPDERPRVVSADPTDDMLLAAAVEGRADVVVTNDAEVLKVGTYRGVRIVSPVEFELQTGEQGRTSPDVERG